MGTKTRRTLGTLGIASVLGAAGLVSAFSGDDTTVRTVPAVQTEDGGNPCDRLEFSGSADAHERRAQACRPAAAGLHGSADSMERQAQG